jgi:hypothetical protein
MIRSFRRDPFWDDGKGAPPAVTRSPLLIGARTQLHPLLVFFSVFGGLLPLWDWLFGTLYLPSDRWPEDFGTHDAVPDGLVVRALPALLAQGRVPFASRADARQGPVSRNGSFEVAGVTPGVLYELRAGAADERWEDESLWSPPTFAAVSEDRAQVAWEPDASVILGVFDAGSRSAVAACEITLEGALPARTLFDEPSSDPNGMRTVEGVRPLRPFQGAMVRVRSRGFQPVSQRLELRPGSGVSIGHLSLGPLPALAVHVVDAATGAPLRGAIVTATEISTDRDASDLAPQGIATDAAGEARVCSYVGAGSRVEVRASGYATMRRLGPLGGGFSSPRLEFRLVRGATARVRAVDGEGRVVAGTRIEWIEGDWSPNDVAAFETPRPISERPDPGTSRIADLEGRAVFRHLAPGRHAFRVQHYGDYLDSEWTQRDLRDGEDLEIELQSRARTSLEVRVSDGGIPLAGAPAVLVRRPRGSSLLQLAEVETPLPPGLDAHLDARGTWVFLNVDPGLYALALGVPGQRLRACREVKVREGSNVLLLDLAHTAVAGRVGWTGGRPAGGAELFLAAPDRERVLREGARRRGFQGIPSAELLALGVEHPAASVDENGEFRLLGLPLAEPFTIVARAGLDGLGRSEPVLIQADSGPQDVPFAVLPAGSVELRASSRPMAWPCTVVAFPMKGSSGRGSSGERRSDEKQALPRIRRIFPGCAEILGALEPGVWEIELGYEGTRARDRRRVEIVAGETRSVELSLP